MLPIYSNQIVKLKNLEQKRLTFPDCKNYGVCRPSHPNLTSDDVKLNALHQKICTHFEVDYLEEMDIEWESNKRLTGPYQLFY